MREFFKGWRRKAGCVLLVIAIAFAGVWTRSLVAMDYAELEVGSSEYVLVSAASRLGFWRQTWVNGNDEPLRFDYGTGGLGEWNTYDALARFKKVEWEYAWAGVQVAAGTWPASKPMRIEICLIPLWMITLSLTLLSAYLIIWKPRPKPKAKPDA